MGDTFFPVSWMEKKLPINGLQKGIFLAEKQDIWFYLENILIFVERESKINIGSMEIFLICEEVEVWARNVGTLEMNNNI